MQESRSSFIRLGPWQTRLHFRQQQQQWRFSAAAAQQASPVGQAAAAAAAAPTAAITAAVNDTSGLYHTAVWISTDALQSY